MECINSYHLKDILIGLREEYQLNHKWVENLDIYADSFLEKDKKTRLVVNTDLIKMNSDTDTYLAVDSNNIKFYIKENSNEIIKSLVIYDSVKDLIEIK